MTYNYTATSALTQELSNREEDWQNLVSWDGELYDPLFQGDIGYTATPAAAGYHESFTSIPAGPESITSEQQYEPLSAVSIEGPSSYEYTNSAPPSIVEGQGSFGQRHSWLNGSPITTATSPLVGRDGPPFDACQGNPSPLRTSPASPFFDTQSFGSSGSYQTASQSIFNPYLAGSPHSFSGLDVNASQAFSHAGSWAEPTIEPIPELEYDGTAPIPIPQGGASQSFSNTFSPLPWTQEVPLQQTRSRAITIPQSHRHRPNISSAQRAPPVLSVSPETKRLPRSVPLSRSISKSEPRRSRNRLATPSPTSNTFGWVSYQPNAQTNRLVPSGTDGSRGRRQRGRVGALTAEQRTHAALMRLIGSCSNCKRRKEKCDPGIPCKSCLDHYKGDLVNHPCRDRLLSDLSRAFLAERLGWHPTARTIESFLPSNTYHVSSGFTYPIPLYFGFGPALHVPVHILQVEDTDALCHEHVIYSWPPSSTPTRSGLGPENRHNHAVLPAVLTDEAEFGLRETLDNHLSLLVRQHFRSFPLYCSPLRILREVYVFYRSLPVNSPYSRLLHQALKLLVLVHIGGDITLAHSSTDPMLDQLVYATTLSEDLTSPIAPSPCFIRSQFGRVQPSLALTLMKEVLLSLEQLFLNRECSEWPVALATLITILMIVESIQYHAAKLPYHHSYDNAISDSKLERDSKLDDEGVNQLLAFYSACFPGCQARLSPDWEGETPFQMSAEDKFVQSVREATKRASQNGYLATKANEEKRADDDMGFFFDRFVARLLIIRP